MCLPLVDPKVVFNTLSAAAFEALPYEQQRAAVLRMAHENAATNPVMLLAGGVEAGGIRITRGAIRHIMARHGAASVAKNTSKFARGVNVEGLVQAAEGVTPTVAKNGNLVRQVEAGVEIGVDRATGQATRTYTVVTDPKNKLLTAHPGSP